MLQSFGVGAPERSLPASSAKPLAGKRIVVTRPVRQADKFCALVGGAGAAPLRFPTVSILPPSDIEAARRSLRQAESFDIAIFVSPTAVQEGLALLGRAWPDGVRAAAVGPGTRAELERHGMRAVLAPVSGADSGALLATRELAAVRDLRILIIRGADGREVLADTLRRRGAHVEYVECYRRARADTDLAPLAAQWIGGAVDAATAFSAGALENLLAGLPDAAHRMALETPVFVSHPRIAERAAALGARLVRVAGPADDDMLRGLIAYFTPGSTKPQ